MGWPRPHLTRIIICDADGEFEGWGIVLRWFDYEVVISLARYARLAEVQR